MHSAGSRPGDGCGELQLRTKRSFRSKHQELVSIDAMALLELIADWLTRLFGNLYLYAWRKGFSVTFGHRSLTGCGAALEYDSLTSAFLVGRDA